MPLAGIEDSSLRKAKGELSAELRLAILYAYQAGVTQSKLAIDFGCSRKTIFNTIQRFKQHNTLGSLPRSGRPMVFSDRTRHYIYLQPRRHPF